MQKYEDFSYHLALSDKHFISSFRNEKNEEDLPEMHFWGSDLYVFVPSISACTQYIIGPRSQAEFGDKIGI